MVQLLKVLKAYIVLAVLAAASLIAWRITSNNAWFRLQGDDDTMSPMLHPAQLFRVNRQGLEEGLFAHGEVVVYVQDPRDPEIVRVARVVALGGERVAIVKGEVRVNGQRVADAFSDRRADGDFPEIVLPRGYLYLLVDSRSDQGRRDSRTLGPIAASRILGRVVL